MLRAIIKIHFPKTVRKVKTVGLRTSDTGVADFRQATNSSQLVLEHLRGQREPLVSYGQPPPSARCGPRKATTPSDGRRWARAKAHGRMQSTASMRQELASVKAEITVLRRELGLPAAGPLPGTEPVRPVSMLPRTMTEEQRQVQSALAMSSAGGMRAAVEPYVPPRTIKIKRQVSGIDGMRTMSPQQNPLSRPAPVSDGVERDDEDEDGEEAEWAPLTRQVSGVRGMHVL